MAMLPDYETCVTRIAAYNHTAALRPPLMMGFGNFWAYKAGVEGAGASILDEDHLPQTAANLEQFLIDWGMARTGIANPAAIQVLLRNVRPQYNRIRGVALGHGQIRPHGADLESLYQGLDGITNTTIGPGGLHLGESSITGKSKALIAIWGQTPGFDKLTRDNLLDWVHLPAPLTLHHLQHGLVWYTPAQFVDIIADLDEWVCRWPQHNHNMPFVQTLAPLTGGMPAGRIIDQIYNW
jgi:hypothetical protein